MIQKYELTALIHGNTELINEKQIRNIDNYSEISDQDKINMRKPSLLF